MAALGEKSGDVGSSHCEDGIRKATVVDKDRAAQKAIEKVGDRQLPREKIGPDKPMQDVEESLDNKEEGPPPPSAMNGERSRAKEHHDFFVADSTGEG